MLFLILLAASASDAAQLDEGRRLLRSSRAEISRLIASDPSAAFREKSRIMDQTSNAGQLWSACVRLKVIDKTASSSSAESVADAALTSYEADREEFQNWVRLAAQANGESPLEPDVEAVVNNLRAAMRDKAIQQVGVDRRPKRQ